MRVKRLRAFRSLGIGVRIPAQGNRCMYWSVRLCTWLCTCVYTFAWTLSPVVENVREQVHVQGHLEIVFADRFCFFFLHTVGMYMHVYKKENVGRSNVSLLRNWSARFAPHSSSALQFQRRKKRGQPQIATPLQFRTPVPRGENFRTSVPTNTKESGTSVPR